jgi:adenylate kinase family enzyme
LTFRLHITGASGAGTTALGCAAAARYDVPLFDSDDYYWLQTDPPFREARPREDRLALLEPRLTESGAWVLSGSNHGWADPLIRYYTLVVYLSAPTEIRLERLRTREREEFGEAIAPGGHMHEQFTAFIDWAAAYDDGPTTMRSQAAHEQWLATLPCPVLRLDGTRPIAELLEALAEPG